MNLLRKSFLEQPPEDFDEFGDQDDIQFDKDGKGIPNYAAGLQLNLQKAIIEGEQHARARARQELEEIDEGSQAVQEEELDYGEDMPEAYSEVGSFQIDQKYEEPHHQSLFMNEPAKNNMLEMESQGPLNTSMKSSPVGKQMVTRPGNKKPKPAGYQWH